MTVDEARASLARWVQTVERILATDEEVGLRRYVWLSDELRRLRDYTRRLLERPARTDDRSVEDELMVADLVVDLQTTAALLVQLHARLSIDEMEAARAGGIDLEDIMSPGTRGDEDEDEEGA